MTQLLPPADQEMRNLVAKMKQIPVPERIRGTQLREAIGPDKDKVCTYCWNGKE